jgi:hypothetical protein
MSGTEGDPQQGEESPDVRTLVPSDTALLLEEFAGGIDRRRVAISTDANRAVQRDPGAGLDPRDMSTA